MKHKGKINSAEWEEANFYNERKFKNWWKKKKPYFNWFMNSGTIAFHCHKHFKIWYNANRFNWAFKSGLEHYCQNFEHIWKRDYVIRQLIGENNMNGLTGRFVLKDPSKQLIKAARDFINDKDDGSKFDNILHIVAKGNFALSKYLNYMNAKDSSFTLRIGYRSICFEPLIHEY